MLKMQEIMLKSTPKRLPKLQPPGKTPLSARSSKHCQIRWSTSEARRSMPYKMPTKPSNSRVNIKQTKAFMQVTNRPIPMPCTNNTTSCFSCTAMPGVTTWG